MNLRSTSWSMIQRSLILDSHVALWAIQDRGQLRTETLQAIDDSGNRIFVSAASIWELAIKRVSGKLQCPENFAELVERAGYIELPITFRHAELAAGLPLFHRDPFDRMLVAQAQAEGLTLVTDDALIARYAVPIMPAR